MCFDEDNCLLQGIVTEINQAIGATGVVSNECKMVVQQYGDQIIEMLLAQVIVICIQVGYAHKVWFLLFSGGDKLGSWCVGHGYSV